MSGPSETIDPVWSILRKLARLNLEQEFASSRILNKTPTLEDCLRRVLRPHDEAGFHSVQDRWMIELREELDRALTQLTTREICFQLDVDAPLPPQVILDDLKILFASDAFLRYLDAYLYFGIRFLADRLELGNGSAPRCADSNARVLPLVHPHTLVSHSRAAALESFLHALQNDDVNWEIRTALWFLDGIHQSSSSEEAYDGEEKIQFELWLRGLWPATGRESQEGRFTAIRNGLSTWAKSRGDFYLSLNPRSVDEPASAPIEGLLPRPPQGWVITNPIAARLALEDFYWIARLLWADVSSMGTVQYKTFNWLQLLRFRALYEEDSHEADRLRIAEDVLRSVFDFACDLVQNSVEITRAREHRESATSKKQYDPSSPHSANLNRCVKHWRAVFNEELQEIIRQRQIRHFRDPSLPLDTSAGVGIKLDPASSATSDDGVWSDRLTTGEYPLNLIGLAFSGGGIRSATLNLGVLQGMQELDMLRHMDYISTVSGGGFTGSWLVANVRRSAHWLGRLTDWSDSIAHLRAYSNYLAPRTGILSADTWNLGNSWLRNAFLIQLTGLAWLFVLLLTTIETIQAFNALVRWHYLTGIGLIAALVALISVLKNLVGAESASKAKHRSAKWVRRTAVIPACIGGYALAARLWAQALTWFCNGGIATDNKYSGILFSAVDSLWWWLILLASFSAFFAIAWSTLRRKKYNAIWIAFLCDVALYLELAGILYVFRVWTLYKQSTSALAFVFGPSLVLCAFGVSILLLIGFTGRNTDEAQREWWTRFGTWLGILAGLGLVLCSITIFGPFFMSKAFTAQSGQPIPTWLQAIKWSSVVSWIGTVVGGLLAGKSSKTEGDASSKSPWLEALAKVGGFLFIFGSLLLGATLLAVILRAMFSSDTYVYPDFISFFFNLMWWKTLICLITVLSLGVLFSSFFEINIFGLNQFYRNRLVRCYLGATRWTPGARKPNPFTGFDFRDDLDLSRFRSDSKAEGLTTEEGDPVTECGAYRGPLPIINCTLNLGGSADLALNTRHSDSFTLTPLHCGSNRPKVGYAPTTSSSGKFADGVRLGQAVAISGAAVSSNMGYNTSPLVAFLLTMFNVRLGWWFPNPSQTSWKKRGLSFSFLYLLCELFGTADDNRAYLNVSDGGHFENLGIYELIRRRCRLIIACDAECDESLEFGGLGNLMRICKTDLGATIQMDVKSLRPKLDGNSLAHCAVGLIHYSSGEIGRLIYLKASVTGDEDVGIAQYRSSHPSFPHETTANQFFTEDQFESYRGLGLHIVRTSFKGTAPGDDPWLTAERLADVLTPAGCLTPDFLTHSATLAGIWEKFRAATPTLNLFMNELLSIKRHPPVNSISTEELCIGMELIQLMEDVFLDLRLDEFWDHPDNRGWAFLFMRWARSPRFQNAWNQAHRTFGIRFEYFCSARLGLSRDRPISRV